jgi:glycosyltransferase involved in cell wall biosynthesis
MKDEKRENRTSHKTIAASVVIHTLNEEINLPAALKSIDGVFAQVFVVDAGSTDRTLDIARERGAQVFQIKGSRESLVAQRNWALSNLPFKNEWVFILDADEMVPEDLQVEIRSAIEKGDPGVDGFWIRYKEIILGRWVKRAAIYPNWNMRLFRHAIGRYEKRTVNAHVNIPYERTAMLRAHFIHDDKRGFRSYIGRLAGVAAFEAQSFDELYKENNEIIRGRLFSKSAIERRRALKKIYYRLPMRPLLMFVYLYVLRLGVLEGRVGLYASLYRSIQELFATILRYERVNSNG